MKKLATNEIICPYCAKVFTRADNVKRHMRRQHKNFSTTQPPRKLKSWKCHFCNEESFSKNVFLSHVLACRFNPTNMKILPKMKKYVCDLCKQDTDTIRTFKSRANLAFHKDRFHTKNWNKIKEKDKSSWEAEFYQKQLLNGTLDPHLLYNVADFDKTWSKRFNCITYRSLFAMSPLAIQLAGVGLLVECVALVLKSLLNILESNSEIFAIQIALDAPDTLEIPISTPLQLVQKFSLNKLLTQVISF